MFWVSPSSMLFLPKFFNKYFNKNFAGSRESLLPKQNFVVLGSICYFTINRFISELWHFGRRILHFIELLTNNKARNKDACWSDLFLSLEILQNCLLYHFCRSVVCKTVGTGRGLKPDPHLTGDCLRDWWSWRLTTGADKMWRVPERGHPIHQIPPTHHRVPPPAVNITHVPKLLLVKDLWTISPFKLVSVFYNSVFIEFMPPPLICSRQRRINKVRVIIG